MIKDKYYDWKDELSNRQVVFILHKVAGERPVILERKLMIDGMRVHDAKTLMLLVESPHRVWGVAELAELEEWYGGLA